MGTPQITPQILCAFLRDSGTPIFQAPKPQRSNLWKNLRIAHQKSAQKSAHKNLRKKSAQKSAHKSAHQNQRKHRTTGRCEVPLSER